jgi:hypothetical protein
MDTANPARLPAVKARMRSRLSWNSGWATLVSITINAASNAAPLTSVPTTNGLVQPMESCP